MSEQDQQILPIDFPPRPQKAKINLVTAAIALLVATVLCLCALMWPVDKAEGKALAQCNVPKTAVNNAVQYKTVMNNLHDDLGWGHVANMYHNQMPRYGVHQPIVLLSIAAKESAGNRWKVSGNKVGLLQIEGYGPLRKYTDPASGLVVNNNYHWKYPRRNLIEGIMMLDRIALDFFGQTGAGGWYDDEDLAEIAGIFHCSGNRYTIRYDCPGKTNWQNDWYNCWIMPVTVKYNK